MTEEHGSTFQLGSPDTLLGQLQRGHGRGYLNALKDSQAPTLVLHCIEHDPRWDRQLENRDAYYARLAMELHIDPSAIAAIYTEQEPLQDMIGPLAGRVLAQMAIREDTKAKTHISNLLQGPCWQGVLSDVLFLENTYQRSVLTSDEVSSLVRRIDDDELMELRNYFGYQRFKEDSYISDRVQRIRQRWAEEDEVIRQKKKQKQRYIMPKTSMDTATLLRQVTRQTAPKTIKILAERRDKESVDLVVRAARSEDAELASAALRVLGRQGSTAAFQDVCEALEKDPGTPGWPDLRTRMARFRYLEGLAADVTLPLARDWLHTGGARRIAASILLSMHATSAERGMVEDALGAALAKCEVYRAYNMIEALGVIADPASAGLLRRAFYELPYSRARTEVLKSLMASGSEVGESLAEESLWDSEDEAREVAIAMVKADAHVATRVRQMAQDPFEDERVREAAAQWRAST